MLGYTRISWDDGSGQEQQPASADKYWANLTHSERAAAAILGYTETTWDADPDTTEQQPASFYKHWDELTSCGKYPHRRYSPPSLAATRRQTIIFALRLSLVET